MNIRIYYSTLKHHTGLQTDRPIWLVPLKKFFFTKMTTAKNKNRKTNLGTGGEKKHEAFSPPWSINFLSMYKGNEIGNLSWMVKGQPLFES